MNKFDVSLQVCFLLKAIFTLTAVVNDKDMKYAFITEHIWLGFAFLNSCS